MITILRVEITDLETVIWHFTIIPFVPNCNVFSLRLFTNFKQRKKDLVQPHEMYFEFLPLNERRFG
jgi:hypothetical protein